MDWNCIYGFAPGFSFRRESFGGILFHFEGRAPDPRLYFVDSPFLIDLLEQVTLAPLAQVMAEARSAFGLDEAQSRSMRDFFQTLVEKDALVSQS